MLIPKVLAKLTKLVGSDPARPAIRGVHLHRRTHDEQCVAVVTDGTLLLRVVWSDETYRNDTLSELGDVSATAGFKITIPPNAWTDAFKSLPSLHGCVFLAEKPTKKPAKGPKQRGIKVRRVSSAKTTDTQTKQGTTPQSRPVVSLKTIGPDSLMHTIETEPVQEEYPDYANLSVRYAFDKSNSSERWINVNLFRKLLETIQTPPLDSHNECVRLCTPHDAKSPLILKATNSGAGIETHAYILPHRTGVEQWNT